MFVDQAAAALGFAKPKVVDNGFGARLDGADYNQERLIMDKAFQFSMDDAAERATVKRVAFLGDDGYGYGSVGRIQ